MPGRVLVVDDDPMLVRFLRRGLEQRGYSVTAAESVSAALKRVVSDDPEVVLLDLMLPDGNGEDLCHQLRANSDRLIIVLSARREVANRVQLLDNGADDYLVKPFDFTELIARMRALSRRAHANGQAMLTCADLVINVDQRLVIRAAREVQLTGTEFRLLVLLAKKAGQPLDEEYIADCLWGTREAAVTSNRIEVHIHRLRGKLQHAGEQSLLHTVRGSQGGAAYVLRLPER